MCFQAIFQITEIQDFQEKKIIVFKNKQKKCKTALNVLQKKKKNKKTFLHQ
jgi:hypothetical protein